MNTQPILNLHTWVSLPNEVRFRIRKLFSIPQSGNVFVNDGRVETDGTTPEDFRALTVDKMREYLNSLETDFNKLFDLVVVKILNEINPPVIKVEEIKNANPIKEDAKETIKENKQVKKGNRK